MDASPGRSGQRGFATGDDHRHIRQCLGQTKCLHETITRFTQLKAASPLRHITVETAAKHYDAGYPAWRRDLTGSGEAVFQRLKHEAPDIGLGRAEHEQ